MSSQIQNSQPSSLSLSHTTYPTYTPPNNPSLINSVKPSLMKFVEKISQTQFVKRSQVPSEHPVAKWPAYFPTVPPSTEYPTPMPFDGPSLSSVLSPATGGTRNEPSRKSSSLMLSVAPSLVKSREPSLHSSQQPSMRNSETSSGVLTAKWPTYSPSCSLTANQTYTPSNKLSRIHSVEPSVMKSV